MRSPLEWAAAAAVAIAGASTAAAQTSAPIVPLCAGVTIVTAVNQKDGDYESIKTIVANDARGLRLKYSTERTAQDMLDGPKFVKVTTHRLLRPTDLERATSYLQLFSEDLPELVPDTTSIGTSTEVLRRLKRGESVEVGVFIPGFLGKPSLNREEHPNLYDYEVRGPITAASPQPETISVLVDGQPTDLLAIRATGELAGDKMEFVFLDELANPLTLKMRLGIGAVSEADADLDRLSGGTLKAGDDRDVMEVVKISTRCDGGAGRTGPGADAGEAALERALDTARRAEVYDIYFSFNSDQLREESEPTLRAIASLLGRHPEWRLTIEGHTDSVASEAFNLDLSRRRAEAVRRALLGRYKIDGARLTTGGFGESRPKDANNTLKGRARNRRVELVRQ